MTIEKLYNWAKAKNVLDYNLSIIDQVGNFDTLNFKDIKIDKDYKEIVITYLEYLLTINN